MIPAFKNYQYSKTVVVASLARRKPNKIGQKNNLSIFRCEFFEAGGDMRDFIVIKSCFYVIIVRLSEAQSSFKKITDSILCKIFSSSALVSLCFLKTVKYFIP